MLCDMRLMHRYGSRYENRKRVVWYAACSTACADMVEGMKIGGRAWYVYIHVSQLPVAGGSCRS